MAGGVVGDRAGEALDDSYLTLPDQVDRGHERQDQERKQAEPGDEGTAEEGAFVLGPDDGAARICLLAAGEADHQADPTHDHEDRGEH